MPAAQSRRHGAQGGRERPSRHRRHPPVEAATGLVVEATLTPPSKMDAARRKLFESSSLLKESMGKISREYEKQSQGDDTLSVEENQERTESEPVVKMASLIFNEAIKLNASDIHIEPTDTARWFATGSTACSPGTWMWHGTCTCAHLAHQDQADLDLQKSACRRTAVSGTTTMGRCSISVCQLYLPTTAKKP